MLTEPFGSPFDVCRYPWRKSPLVKYNWISRKSMGIVNDLTNNISTTADKCNKEL